VIEQEISQNPNSVDINDISLESFIENNKFVQTLDNEISEKTNTNLIDIFDTVDTSYVPKLEYLNVTNIEQLLNLLKERKQEIIQFAVLFNENSEMDGGYFTRGISIFYLCYLLIAERNNISDLNYFVHKFWDSNDNELVSELISTYQKIKNQ
jgi:putative GTP pyrophosphokinase